MDFTIRPEQPTDIALIEPLTKAAFEGLSYSEGLEGAIVANLRRNKQLSISLVAISKDSQVVGHIAFSPITIDGEHGQWYGLGPLSVAPSSQGQGIGKALVQEGLKRLQQSPLDTKGCLLLGNPAYYERFGFRNKPGLTCDAAPAAHVLALSLCGEELPTGKAKFHRSFWAANAREDGYVSAHE